MKIEHTEKDLLGTWQCFNSENNVHNKITITFKKDHTLHYVFSYEGGQNEQQTKWEYSQNCLIEHTPHNTILKANIQWITDDYFVLVIVDNGNLYYKGKKRHYKRVLAGI